eukprot:gb/GFBE01050006.1/.p1 GENE.gb/GFBE01050006.1/~~gb/GFBE01050006.1/.p1  ORF type:complete len:207 (+),score=24.83 gb/GFBE01050006.1/:1-621(+)
MSEAAASLHVQVVVTSLSGEERAVINKPSDQDVSALQNDIAREEGTPVWQQQLLCGGIPMAGASKLSEYGPCDEGRMYVTLLRRSTFSPASGFEGSRPGYSFKTGEHGLGYYMDDYEERRAAAVDAQPYDGCWLVHPDESTIVIEDGTVFWGDGATSAISAVAPGTFTTTLPERRGTGAAQLVGHNQLTWEGTLPGGLLQDWTRRV